MTIEELKSLLESGEFHHATYREFGRIHEGLWIYKTTPGRLRGFDVAGAFLKHSPDIDKAHDMVRHTGISVGCWGGG